MLIVQALKRNAAFRGRDAAIIDLGMTRDWSGFVDRVARLAGGLLAQGAKPKDRIGVLALNSSGYLEAQCAIWWMGGCFIPLNTRWSFAELSYALEDASIGLLFADATFHADAQALRAALPGLNVIGMGGPGPSDKSDVEALIAGNDAIAPLESDPSALAGVYYTGGTTGFPKGVMLSHMALWVNAVSVALATELRAEDRILHATPMFHLADGGFSLAATLVGAAHAFIPKFVPSTMIEAIGSLRLTKLLLVPTMLQMLLADPTYKPERLTSLERLMFGASPMPDAVLAQLQRDLPGLTLVHTYGQTEMGPTVSYLPPKYQYPGSPKARSVGLPFASVEAKVVDSTGAEVEPGISGEIWARGPGQMMGYINKSEETAAAMVDGWVRTGDIAYRDEDGFFYVCDRAKDMIISGGENVFSGEVENALLAHPAVSQAAVIAIPHPELGESVHAVVVLEPDSSVELNELREHCRTLISPYKCPRSMEVKDSLPISAAGKVLKRELREPFWHGRTSAVS